MVLVCVIAAVALLVFALVVILAKPKTPKVDNILLASDNINTSQKGLDIYQFIVKKHSLNAFEGDHRRSVQER